MYYYYYYYYLKATPLPPAPSLARCWSNRACKLNLSGLCCLSDMLWVASGCSGGLPGSTGGLPFGLQGTPGDH